MRYSEIFFHMLLAIFYSFFPMSSFLYPSTLWTSACNFCTHPYPLNLQIITVLIIWLLNFLISLSLISIFFLPLLYSVRFTSFTVGFYLGPGKEMLTLVVDMRVEYFIPETSINIFLNHNA